MTGSVLGSLHDYLTKISQPYEVGSYHACSQIDEENGHKEDK